MAGSTHALIVGAGTGLSASLARLLAREGMTVTLAARDDAKLSGLAGEIGGQAFACDAADARAVSRLFSQLDDAARVPSLVVYNPSFRTRGPITDLDPEAVRSSLMVTAFGAFLVAQEAARRMLAAGQGTMLFTGASAGVKGYPRSAPFAMGKFALRGLCQSLARELHPQNVHVGHVVIDGAIRDVRREPPAKPDSQLDPEALAQAYLQLHRQPRSTWAWEVELRPWVEVF